MSRWFNLKAVFSLSGVAAAAAAIATAASPDGVAIAALLDGDPTLPLVDTDWPETVVPHDLVVVMAPPPPPPPPLETPSCWGLLPPLTIFE